MAKLLNISMGIPFFLSYVEKMFKFAKENILHGEQEVLAQGAAYCTGAVQPSIYLSLFPPPQLSSISIYPSAFSNGFTDQLAG